MDVTAKELKQRLGQYLAAVENGQTVRVTKHGKIVAELTRPAMTTRERMEHLVAQGTIRRGAWGPWPSYEPAPGGRSGTEIILEDRASEDRRR